MISFWLISANIPSSQNTDFLFLCLLICVKTDNFSVKLCFTFHQQIITHSIECSVGVHKLEADVLLYVWWCKSTHPDKYTNTGMDKIMLWFDRWQIFFKIYSFLIPVNSDCAKGKNNSAIIDGKKGAYFA